MSQQEQQDLDPRARRRQFAAWRRLRGTAGAFRTRFARRRSRSDVGETEDELFKAGTPQDVTSVRAKSSRHRKSTADKWNQ